MNVGNYVALYLENNSYYRIEPEYWNELDAAYGNWVEKKIDKLLCLVELSGEEIRIAASKINDMRLATLAGRAKGELVSKALKDELGFQLEN